jgi:hypothetical protein
MWGKAPLLYRFSDLNNSLKIRDKKKPGLWAVKSCHKAWLVIRAIALARPARLERATYGL